MLLLVLKEIEKERDGHHCGGRPKKDDESPNDYGETVK
jgi:hypothetical protein